MFKVINKLNVILGVILLLMAVSLFLYAQNNSLRNNERIEENSTNNISEVCLKSNCFNVEIADTSQEREMGLMNREHLAPTSGMLFVFEKEGIYNSWMKNTLIPLDMIWIDGNNKIIFIKENAQPCKTKQCESFGPDEKAKYMLEINGGLVGEMGLKVDDEVDIK